MIFSIPTLTIDLPVEDQGWGSEEFVSATLNLCTFVYFTFIFESLLMSTHIISDLQESDDDYESPNSNDDREGSEENYESPADGGVDSDNDYEPPPSEPSDDLQHHQICPAKPSDSEYIGKEHMAVLFQLQRIP